MSSPDARLCVRFKGFVRFVNILVNGEYSSDDEVSWGCSSWQAGTANVQDEKEKCDVDIDDEAQHGHGTVFLLWVWLLNLLPLSSFWLSFLACSRVILSFSKHLERARRKIPSCFLLHSLKFSYSPLQPCPLLHSRWVALAELPWNCFILHLNTHDDFC